MEEMIFDNDTSPERRRTPRLPYQSPASYTNAVMKGAGTVKDISAEGMFLETGQALHIGEQISIAFRFRHSKHTMTIQGKIARKAPGGVGVQFLWS